MTSFRGPIHIPISSFRCYDFFNPEFKEFISKCGAVDCSGKPINIYFYVSKYNEIFRIFINTTCLEHVKSTPFKGHKSNAKSRKDLDPYDSCFYVMGISYTQDDVNDLISTYIHDHIYYDLSGSLDLDFDDAFFKKFETCFMCFKHETYRVIQFQRYGSLLPVIPYCSHCYYSEDYYRVAHTIEHSLDDFKKNFIFMITHMD